MKIEVYRLPDKGTYKVKFSQGVQHFILDYEGSRQECGWMKTQLQKAFNAFKKERKK